jgi:hypothetical protein
MLRTSILGLLWGLLWGVFLAPAQAPPTPGSAGNSPHPSPNEVVRRIVDHEIDLEDKDHTHWMYKDVTNLPAPSKAKTVIETGQGELTCLDAVDNHPLTPEQQTEEQQRIHQFVGDPGQQRKAQRASRADDDKSAELFSILPDAFVFMPAESNGDTVKYTFHPNPDFHPHSMEAYVFHRMDGFVILNTRQDRLVEIAGTLTKGVQFFGGLLGHLDPGGTFDVRLVEVAPQVWKISQMKVNMHGKALFFKTIGDQEDETRSDFRQVPEGMTLSEAEQILLKHPPANRSGS